MKKVISTILTVAMLIAVCPMCVVNAATSGTCGSNVTWTLNNGTLTISGTGDMKDYYWNYDAQHSDSPFYSNSNVKSIVIAKGVTRIGSYAFERCSSLTSVTIPDSVTSIGDGAFYRCSNLTSITIPDSVTSIGEDAFYYCSSLTSVTIPDSVTSIGNYAFSGCSGLTSVTIPDSVTSIGIYAFYGCSGITSIDVAANNPNYCSVDGNLFSKDKTELIQYTVGKQDTSYTIPDSVTSIGNKAFRGCSSLTSVTIPDSVTSIGNSAFFGCRNLTSITIPDSVTSIGSDAFLDTAYYKDSNNWENGVLYIGNHLIRADSDTISGDYNIKDGTKTIANDAFSGISFTSLGGGACSNLTSVTIPDSVTSIGDRAFYGCSGLTSVTIPDSITYIGYEAFRGCSSLTSVTIPNSVTSIGDRVFYGCSGLTSVTIPDSVTSIGMNAFYKCSSLTSVTIPDSVKSIGNYAFSNCSKLTSVTIPDSVTSIGYDAFRGCSNLTSITIPDSVTSIGEGAFMYCSSLTSITIPDSVTSIGSYAFRGCNLTDVYYGGAKEDWDKISIGDYNTELTDATLHYTHIANGTCGDNLTWLIDNDGILTISGTGTINNYKSTTTPWYNQKDIIKAVIIENGVTSIGNEAFYGCSGLTSVTIGNGVTSIGDSAFDDCNGLTSVKIGNSVTSIGSNAFSGCEGLTDVYYEGTQREWDAITISDGNECLKNAEIHYGKSMPLSGTFGSTAWEIIGDTLRISGSEMGEGSAEDMPWYYYRQQIKNIEIESGIKGITDYAFYDMKNVTSVNIPNTVVNISNYAFYGCSSLQSVTIPSSVTGIGEYAFAGTGLTKTVVPSSVLSIGQGAFENAPITEITLPFIGSMPGESNTKNTFSYIFNGSVPSTLKKVTITHETDVPENAFQNCEHIEIININDSITSIGSGAFDGCKSLKSFDVPKNIVTIGDNTFRNCEKAIRITVPDTVKEIGMGAFDGCKSITEFTIPSGISALENSTFANCTSLTEIEIPLSVTYIGKGVLQNCNRLVDVKIPFVGANADPALSDTELKKSFGHIFGVSNKNIPPSVTKVEITGTDLTMYIPDNAFKDCGNVADIIVDGGRSIGNYAFANCKNLKNVYIPKSIKNMGDKILQGCTRIETLVVPFIGINRQDANTETSVIGAFFGWDDQDIATGTRQYYDNNKSSHLYQIPPTLKNVSVLNQTNIPAGAFSECSLENVSIISGAVMNDYVFYNCTELKKVSLPSNMTNIGVEAFAECENLETINIPTKVKKIGDHAFYGARGLKDVTMPDSITEFAEDIFDSSIALFSVDEVNLLSDDGCVITCAKDSAAYNYAVKKGIKTNVVSADKLDKRSTATSVSLLSDNSYLFDITDSYSMSGVLHIDLYNANADIVKKREQAVNGTDVEYKAEFSEEDMRGVSFAKIYITDIQGGRVSKTDEIISVDGGEIPIIPESDIEIVYRDGLISFDGTTSIKAGSVLIQAIYDGDVLHSVTEYPVSSSSDIIEVNTDFARGSSKFMLWNGLDKMKPLTNFIVE